ncbi:MAG: serine/threonine-protein kinase [Candidatus Obscuribacterales bacterium]|nr:serine/threonine-protein kinase [Candidatus Obscuribacterales bacterium]
MPNIGDKIDEYELLEFLGQGGNGSVYRSKHPQLGVDVAIKLLNTGSPEVSERYLQRFRREARLAGKLTSPYIAKPLSFGIASATAYIVYEYVSGKNLSQHLAEGRHFSNDEIILSMVRLLSALKDVHESDIVHRDIKPSNIMLTEAGELKLLDFGASIWTQQEGDQRLTATSELVGTPAYMSPEQCAGVSVDARSDLYSAGCILYELLSGEPPFKGATAMDLMLKHMNDPVAPIKAPRPKQAKQIAYKLLSKDPVDRYQKAEATIQELKQVDTTVNTSESLSGTKSISLTVAAAIAIFAIVAGAWTFASKRDKEEQANTFQKSIAQTGRIEDLQSAIDKHQIAKAQAVVDKITVNHRSDKLENLLYQLISAQLGENYDYRVVRENSRKLLRLTELRAGNSLEHWKRLAQFCMYDVAYNTCTDETLAAARKAYNLAAANQQAYKVDKRFNKDALEELHRSSAITLAKVLQKVAPQSPEVKKAYTNADDILRKQVRKNTELYVLDFRAENALRQFREKDFDGAAKTIELAAQDYANFMRETASKPQSPEFVFPLNDFNIICDIAGKKPIIVSDKTRTKLAHILNTVAEQKRENLFLSTVALARLSQYKDPTESTRVLSNALNQNVFDDSQRAFILHQLVFALPSADARGERLRYAKEAVELRKKKKHDSGSQGAIAVAYKVLAAVYLDNQQYQPAVENYNECIRRIALMKPGAPGMNRLKAESLLELAHAYCLMGDSPKARTMLEQGKAFIDAHRKDDAEFDGAAKLYAEIAPIILESK